MGVSSFCRVPSPHRLTCRLSVELERLRLNHGGLLNEQHFLDTEITHHPDGTLSTTVYRKKTHTDRYLDFQSHHPIAHKLAVIKSLFSRANTHCTYAQDKADEERHVSQTLEGNGYPARVISRHKRWVGTHTRQDTPPPSPDSYAIIPYVQNVSEAIRRVLAPLNIRTCFKPHQTLHNLLVHVKDPIPLELRKGVVYKIPCSDCSASYVGQTGRTLVHRVKEHKYALTSGNSEKSAVAEHLVNTGHTIKWEEAQVIDVEPELHQRCILESWHIHCQENAINREQGQLPSVYHQLIKKGQY